MLRGSYGKVCLVKEKATRKLFAMKIMSKKFIFQYSSSENLKNEIRIQRKLRHPHIARLYYYFEDKENVYLILEYCENGNLYHFLRKKKKLSEEDAFIFFFQTCLGMDYIQKRGIIHRDLKPENLLLDSGGNIKVCDFGWSAQANHKVRTTFCGTIEYMAPEMLKNKPYTSLLDNWCLGVLLFELLHGCPPFDGKNESEKILKIKKGKISKFGYWVSKKAEDLIRGLLREKPNERYTMDQIFTHPWMTFYYNYFDIDINKKISRSNVGLSQFNNEFGNLNLKTQEKKKYLGVDHNPFGGGKKPLKKIKEEKIISKNVFKQKAITGNLNEKKSRLERLQASHINSSRIVRKSERITRAHSMKKKKEDRGSFWSSLLYTLGCTVRDA